MVIVNWYFVDIEMVFLLFDFLYVMVLSFFVC